MVCVMGLLQDSLEDPTGLSRRRRVCEEKELEGPLPTFLFPPRWI